MREMLFRGKRIDNGEWVEGDCKKGYRYQWQSELDDYISWYTKNANNEWEYDYAFVIPETVGQYTGLMDKNGTKVFEGDVVEYLGMRGYVRFECGAFGLAVEPYVEWDLIEEQIKHYAYCNNKPLACYNDNFISLWEIYWIHNCENNIIDVLELIGNTHDNPAIER